MNIFFPIGSFFPAQCGGPSNAIYWLANALGRQVDFNVTVVSTDRDIPKEIILNAPIKTAYGQVTYCHTRAHYFPFRLLFHSIVALLHCDVIHLTSIFYPPSFILAIVAVILKKRIIWSARGELYPEALHFQIWKKKPILFLIKILLRNKVIFHATSLEEKKHIKKYFGTKSMYILIPNGIERPMKKIHNSSKGNLFFLYVGRLHPIKGLEVLLNALKESELFTATSFRLIIAGKDNTPYGERLKIMVNECPSLQKKVSFVGQVSGDAKEQLYADAYFLVLPSYSENFGNVVVESLSQGTPVITTTGTPWEMLPERQSGFWVDPTIDGIKTGIENAMQMQQDTYKTFRTCASELAQVFDINHLVHQWVRVYKGN